MAAAADRIVLSARNRCTEVLVVEFHIHPAWVGSFAQAMADNARASLELEPGCRQFDVCRAPADERCFFLYELYDDQPAVQAHLQSPPGDRQACSAYGCCCSKSWCWR